MAKKVVCIHTFPPLINLINELGPRYLPGVEYCHILNEVLVEQVRKKGNAGPAEKQWLLDQVTHAQASGADAVLVTCTILSGFVAEIRSIVDIPILRIDEEMAKAAVSLGTRIGIVVTNPDSIEPSSRVIEDYAAEINKSVSLRSVIADHAFAAIRNGNGEVHDQLVKNKILEIAGEVDVIVLAQASMARILDSFPESDRPVPILSSPILALSKLREILEIEKQVPTE